MCKIVAFTDLKKLNLKKHINNIGNMLLKLEDDGFGYAVQGINGVFGEKTVSKHFKSRLDNPSTIKLPVIKKIYEQFGESGQLMGAGLFHGRTSTNVVDLNNTHPMIKDGWHLIHNGVVTDNGPIYQKETQNDSEDLLHRLIKGIDQVEEHLSGYYAFAAIDSHGNLHVGRDANATLFMAWSPVYESFILATDISILMKLNKMLGAQLGPIDEIDDDVYMVFKGNEIVSYQYIKPRGFTYYESQHSQASLGKSLGPVSEAELQRKYSHHTDEAWHNAIQNIPGLKNVSSEEEETNYYKWRKEVDNMDAGYQVWGPDNKVITIYDFHKLDDIHQQMCIIIRPDGTPVDQEFMDDESLRRV